MLDVFGFFPKMEKMRLLVHNASHGRMSGERASVILQSLIWKTFASCNAWIVFIFATTHLSMVSAPANFSVQSTSYNCSSNVICRGQTHAYTGGNGMQHGRLSFTLEGAPWGAGVAYYYEPVRLLDPFSGRSASFNTSFTVDKVNGVYVGDGMTFLLSANNTNVGDAGEFLGFFNIPATTLYKSVAVEFDTWYNDDKYVQDTSDNHVSFDFASILPVAAQNASVVNVNLGDEFTFYAWVEYDSQSQYLEARVSNNNSRPGDALLSYKVNLSTIVDEYMWVGFSSGCGIDYANFYIGDWTFESFGIPLPATATSPPTGGLAGSKSSGSHLSLILGIALGIVSLLLISIVIGLSAYGRWSGRRQYTLTLGSRWNTRDSVMMQIEGTPEIFSYKQLSVATNHFSEESKLGQGGFGSVYRGMLPSSGIRVAVKKIKGDSSQGEKEFMAEVSIVSQLRHRNLIQLIGWCKDASREKYLLVYDLMPNGSLDKVLFDSAGNHSSCLSWEQRFNIVTGTAAAVDYLHQGWNRQVIHRDIKSSNIMLDEEWNAKLGDFGLARLVDHRRAPNTTLVAGTYGYMAPEVAASGKFTDKTDVFAFGAVVLEIACGRRALATNLPDDEMILVDWVWQTLSEGGLMSTVDRRLENYDSEWMEVMLIIGLLCSHPNPVERPSMGLIVQVLAGNVPVPSIPLSKPTFGSDRQREFLEYINGSKSGSISISRSIPRSMSLTSRETSDTPTRST